ncbi:MAG: hypothetical protein FVQ82_08775 [Planctomycetes bacterium]|nr:hypothetical protein [Planctomycetota bacterium]
MLKTQSKKTIIVCISLLAMTLAVTAFAETIGQRIMRLKREKEQGTSTTYTRGAPPTPPKKIIPTKNITEKPSPPVIIKPVEKPAQPEIIKVVINPVLEPKKAVLNPGDPLNLVPADALVCLRINNFGDSVSKLDQFMLGVPMVPPLSAMANGAIAKLLGSPMLSGINFSGNVIAYLNNDMKAPAPPVVILIPVTTYEEFTSGNPHCSKPDADGISTIAPPNAMLGNMVTAKAPGGKYAYVTLEPLKDALRKTRGLRKSNSLAAKLTANEQKLANTAPIWIYGNIEQAAATFKPILGMALQSVPKQGDLDLAAILLGALDQIKSLSITLTPTEQKLTLGLSITAKPGTEIANTLVADPSAQPGFKLAGYLKDKAAINVAAKLNKPLINKIVDRLLKMVPAGPDGQTLIPAEMKAMIMEKIGIFDTEMAFSLSPTADNVPFTFKHISYVTDPAKANGLYELQLKKISALSGPHGVAMGQPLTYGNTKIYTMKMAAPGGSGGSVNVNMAVSGDIMLSSMGDIAEMKGLIHMTKARAPRPSGDMAKALQMVDNSADMDVVVSLNLLRLISIGGKAASSVPVPQVQMIGGMLSGLSADSRSCMAVAGKISDGRVDVSVVMPKDHLMEVVGAGMQMMMQMMQPATNGSSGSFEVTID